VTDTGIKANTQKHKGKHERNVCVFNGEINYKNKSTKDMGT